MVKAVSRQEMSMIIASWCFGTAITSLFASAKFLCQA